MSLIYLLHKPYRVLTQFTDRDQGRQTLADFIDVPPPSLTNWSRLVALAGIEIKSTIADKTVNQHFIRENARTVDLVLFIAVFLLKFLS